MAYLTDFVINLLDILVMEADLFDHKEKTLVLEFSESLNNYNQRYKTTKKLLLRGPDASGQLNTDGSVRFWLNHTTLTHYVDSGLLYFSHFTIFCTVLDQINDERLVASKFRKYIEKIVVRINRKK